MNKYILSDNKHISFEAKMQ